jgi:hypothetical protein
MATMKPTKYINMVKIYSKSIPPITIENSEQKYGINKERKN